MAIYHCGMAIKKIKATNPPKPLESAVQKCILQAISLRYPRALVWRNENKGTYDPRMGIFRKSNSQWSSVGSPDIFVLVDGILIGLEVKRDRSSKASDKQLQFGADMVRCGGYFLVTCDPQEALFFIDSVLN